MSRIWKERWMSTRPRLRTGLIFLVLALACPTAAWAAGGPARYLKQPEAWFRSDEGQRITANLLSYQAPEGGWPKNLDTTAKPYTGAPKDLHGTFDNGATTDELRFLARAFSATGDARCREAFRKGLDHILVAQYPTGGWPQSYPPDRSYHRHITFNDNAMLRLMEFLREVATRPGYEVTDAEHRTRAQAAFDRGIDCILKCQIRVDGKLTAWCAQHDEKDYSPRPARAFELTSLSGSESVGLVRLLMSLERPSPEVVQSVNAAVAWLREVQLRSVRVEERADKDAPGGKDRVVVEDPTAPPLWARFYEIGTNRPLFSDRDSVKKYRLAEIGHERRNGYAWYGTWAASLLEREYPAWKVRIVAR